MLFLLAALLAMGCGQHKHAPSVQAETHDHEHAGAEGHADHGVEFKVGKGLSVPPSIRDMLGVKIVDVEEGKATRRIELALRVFKSADGFLVASGNATPKDAEFLVPGNKLSVQTPSGIVAGEILSVDESSAMITGLAEVIVQFTQVDSAKDGAFVTAFSTVTNKDDVVVIPKEALLKTAEGYFVYAVNGADLFRTKVGVGGSEGELAEITDGLYAGDRVVLQPVMPLWMAEMQAIRGGKACADGH